MNFFCNIYNNDLKIFYLNLIHDYIKIKIKDFLSIENLSFLFKIVLLFLFFEIIII